MHYTSKFYRERNSGEVIITYKTLPKILRQSFQPLPIVLTYTCPSRYKNSLMKSINKSIKINWVQKPRFVYKGTNRPSINNLSGSGLLKKAIFPSSLAFFKMWPLLFSSFAYFFRKIRVDLNIDIIRQPEYSSKNQLTFWKSQKTNNHRSSFARLLLSYSVSSLEFNICCVFYLQFIAKVFSYNFIRILSSISRFWKTEES